MAGLGTPAVAAMSAAKPSFVLMLPACPAATQEGRLDNQEKRLLVGRHLMGAEPAAPAPAPATLVCKVTVGGQPVTYDRCVGLSHELVIFYWDNVGGNTNGALRCALRYTGGGWGGIGFPSSAGRMVGASALIVAKDSSGAQPG
jgi:hypothetical protein